MRRLLLLLPLLLAANACDEIEPPPPGAFITCDAPGQCPSGLRCALAVGRCFDTLPFCITEDGLVPDGTYRIAAT